ncbi:MAG: clan AA aspartic protease [Piscirickettsiaceae bacterium]|nr:clan AA aspartic protease [Piscirickettsiaceae bacterium]
MGLFNNQVLVEINKQQQLLKRGKTSAEGVTFISGNSFGAVLEINGQEKTYTIGTHMVTAAPSAKVVIWSTQGMYLIRGKVNGHGVDFLVDTGAFAIAFNAATAKRLGLDYLNGNRVRIKTASAIGDAYQVNLNSVQVGAITLNNIQAIVIDGPEPTRTLLGMSFLSQLDMKQSSEMMELKKKF